MTTRGAPNARGLNTRFAQFKLVLLGVLPSSPADARLLRAFRME